MAGEKPAYTEILLDLESKRAALDSLITSMRMALTIGALGQPGEGGDASPYVPMGQGASIELPSGAFLGKSLPASIKIYLSAVKRKQTIREIATALKEGGVETTSDNFENIVTGALNRLRTNGEVLRFKDGWGLAEFYPENLRARIVQETGKTQSRKRSQKAKASKKDAKAKARKKTADAEGPRVDTASEILKILENAAKTPAELTTKIGVSHQSVGFALGRLVKAHKIAKASDGRYGLIATFPKAV